MNRKEDERLQHQLEQKLVSHGLRPPCRVHVAVRNGVVTISGAVQHDYQKRAAVHACRATSGVRSVIDNLQAPGFHSAWTSVKEWETHPPRQPPQPSQEAAPSQPSS